MAFRGHKGPFIDLLLWNGVDIGYLDARGESLLSAALDPFLPVELGSTSYEHTRSRTCHERDPELITLLLEKGAVPGDLLPDLLQAAIDNGAVEWIRQLQAREHDIAGVLARKGSLTAVLEAAMCDQGLATEDPDKTPGFDPLLMLFLDLGVPVAPGDLQRAIRARSTEDVVAVMLEKGGSTYKDAVLEGYGTPLQTLVGSEFRDEAAVVLQEKMLRLLIDAGCDVNLDSACWKATPLQIMCSRSQASGKLARMLISAGADANLTAADLPGDGPWLMRNPPLVLACVTGNAEVVKALLEAGAEVDTGRADFGSPLRAACLPFGRVRGRDRVEIIKMLVKAGANVNAVGEPGGTALGLAAHSALPDVVQTLLDAGADPDLPVGDETLCTHKDVSDSIETRRGRLMGGLRSAFKEMQQGPFGCVTTGWDLEGPSEQRRE